MSQGYTVAVVGATGAVGREMLNILEQRNFPVGELRPLASPRSAGTQVEFRGKYYTVEVATPEAFEGCQLALFSAGGGTSKELAPAAWDRGCVVIDNSSAWRMDPDVPLVVPEVNPDALDDYERKGIVGNPNCSTIQMVVALKPLQDLAGLTRVLISTYQSAAGAGQKGIEELRQQTVDALNIRPTDKKVFPHQLAFNVLPHIDVFEEDGFTREERKMTNETRKILDTPDLPVSATCVRVPVFCGHAEAVYIETETPISVEQARAALKDFPGIVIIDDPSSNQYPMPIDCVEEDAVFVGRLRQDPDVPNGLHLWIVSDNLRKGAALNAVQIAELMIDEYL